VIGRRTFVCGVGFGLIAASLIIPAQQLPKVRRIAASSPFAARPMRNWRRSA